MIFIPDSAKFKPSPVEVEAEDTWSWEASLASARPGRRYRIRRMPSAPIRDRATEAGCFEGAELTCTANGRCAIYFSTPEGRIRRIERQYARFIEVQPA